MLKRDSVDKIVTAYFAAVNAVPFDYKGVSYPVKRLTVSPLLLRGFTCPAGCGGCCPRFSLDYLPSEKHPYPELHTRHVEFNYKTVAVLSDLQDDRDDYYCKHLKRDDGRCNVHGWQPFSCDFELIRFMHSEETVLAATRLFGRGWAKLRVDGEKGALCTITPVSPDSTADAIRKLKRLAQWCEHFGLPHRVRSIIKWAEQGGQAPLVLDPANTSPGFFY